MNIASCVLDEHAVHMIMHLKIVDFDKYIKFIL